MSDLLLTAAHRVIREAERLAALPPLEQLTKIPDSHGRWRYEHQRGGDDPEARERHEWGIHPTDSPAVDTFEDEWGKPHTIHYDPSRAEVRHGRFGHEVYHPGTDNQDWSQGVNGLNPPQGMLWRGMSHEEYENAKKNGYFQSDESMRLGDIQKGKTFFSTGADHAESYASSFAPYEFKPTFSRPAHIVGIPDRPDVPRGPSGKEPTSHEVGVPGQIPFSEITKHYVGQPVAIKPGYKGLDNNWHGWESEGAMHPNIHLQWEDHPVDTPIHQAHKVIREAHQAIEAAGPPIPWTAEQKADIHQLEGELTRREKAKEIGKLDSKNPQSMTDTLQTYNRLHQAAYQAIRLAQAQLEWRRSFDDGTWQLTAQDPSGIFQTVVTGPRVQTMYYAHKAIHEAQALLASRKYTPEERQQHQQQGWRGEPCEDAAHSGQIGGRCTDCGRRVAPERAAHTIIRQALLLLGYSFSDDEYNQHVANVERKLSEWRTAGKDTRTLHGIVGTRGETRWSPARRRQQNALVRDLYQQWAGNVPSEGKAMVMGGLGGAGKGKIQRDPNAPLDTRNYFQIDPDAIKQEMATRGMIPQVEGLSPMEASPLAHEEASELTKRLARMAYHDKRNCVDPDTPILCVDLVWRKAKDLAPGDQVIAFDEYNEVPHPRYPDRTRDSRRFRTATVEANEIVMQEKYEIVTPEGTLVASAGHRWLVRRPKFGQAYKYVDGKRVQNGKYNNPSWGWVTTEELVRGDVTAFYQAPWEADTSWESGWLAGMFDGEGCLHKTGAKNYSLSVGQRVSPTLDRLIGALESLSAHATVRIREATEMRQKFGSVEIQDRRTAVRILGTVRPLRLLDKFSEQGELNDSQVSRSVTKSAIQEITKLEDGPVSALQTSTRTYIANGFLSHNCLWDITMSGENSVAQRIQDMRKAGYNQVDGVFVDADPATARERANRRHRKGEESYREGQGMGGRVVPQNVSTSNNPTPGSPYLSRNAEVFNKIRPHFDNSLVYNVTGEQPAITSASGSRWANSLQKAGAR